MTSSTMITISVPLTRADRQQAQNFRDLQSNPAKANQVYENTLAVLATHRYLTMIDIPTDLENSHSQNPIAFLSANVADLYVSEARGRLECRAVRAGEETCFIPKEVWSDGNQGNRIGYVVVQLNETNTEAIVLGFVPEVSVERLPLSYLRSLDDLIECVGKKVPLPLRDWGNKDITFAGWQIFENILDWLQSSNSDFSPAFSGSRGRTLKFRGKTSQELVRILQTEQNQETFWQAAEELWEIEPSNPAGGAKRIMDLGVQMAGSSVSLMVAMLEKPEHTVAILVRVYPSGQSPYLPEGITLSILDEFGNAIGLIKGEVTKSGMQDNYIQRKFVAEPGEQFGFRLALGDSVLEEYFVV